MTQTNFKLREVYCPYCKTYIITDEPTPTCQECKNGMVTVIYSLLTGERITGNDMVKRNSQTT